MDPAKQIIGLFGSVQRPSDRRPPPGCLQRTPSRLLCLAAPGEGGTKNRLRRGPGRPGDHRQLDSTHVAAARCLLSRAAHIREERAVKAGPALGAHALVFGVPAGGLRWTGRRPCGVGRFGIPSRLDRRKGESCPSAVEKRHCALPRPSTQSRVAEGEFQGPSRSRRWDSPLAVVGTGADELRLFPFTSLDGTGGQSLSGNAVQTRPCRR